MYQHPSYIYYTGFMQLSIYMSKIIAILESRELLTDYRMPYFRDSFIPEEANFMDLPSKICNKRPRLEPELLEKTENQTKKRSMTEFYRYECDDFHRNIIDDSNNNKPDPSPASTSTTSPQSSVLQHEHHLLSHIPLQRCSPTKSPLNLPKIKPFSNSVILTSPTQSTSRDFSLELEPTHFAPAMNLRLGPPLKLDPELSPSQLSSKVKVSHRATTNNGSSLSLGSSSKFNSYIRSERLSRQSSFKSTTSSESYQSKPEPYVSCLSNNLFLKVKPEFIPSSQLSIRPTFRSTINSVINLISKKSESKTGEELDTQLSLGSNHSAASSSTVDTNVSQGIETSTSSISKLQLYPSQLITPELNTTSSISKFGISPSQSPERKFTPSISKLGLPPCQLRTPKKHTFEQKIDFLRQETKSPMDSTNVGRIDALAQARIESIRRERQLKEHLNRNKVSSTKAEDLLSQSLRMGRFSVQCAETGKFREKRSRESSWSKKQMKEYTPRSSYGEGSVWRENSRTRYFTSRNSRRESPTSESWRRKNLIASQKQNIEIGSVTSQGAKLSLFRSGTSRDKLESIPSSTGIKEKEMAKELGSSLQWSQPNFQQHKWSPGDIDLNLGLQTPSTSSQGAEKATTTPSFLSPQMRHLQIKYNEHITYD